MDLKTQEFIPALRLVVCSDVHIGSANDLYCARLRTLMRTAYAIAAQDAQYRDVDAFLVAGDATDRGTPEQYAAFADAVRTELRGKTQMRAVVAKNHDNWTGEGKSGLVYYRAATGLPTDFHMVLRGFHIIGISTCDTEGAYYTPQQREWLETQLRESTAQDSGRPVFVLHHEHVKDTVYGSTDTDGWGIAYFKDIFERYPQVVHLSGHSHYPINDPRSVYQKDFTAFGVGSLHYAELTVDGQNKIRPADNREMCQGWILEADAHNCIRLRGFDFLTNTQIAFYQLAPPADKSRYSLTPQQQRARSGAPVFPPQAALCAVQTDDAVFVTVPRAQSTDGFPVVLYRAHLIGTDGTTLCSGYTIPPYWYANAIPAYTVRLHKPDVGFTVRAAAENAYGMASDYLTADVQQTGEE